MATIHRDGDLGLLDGKVAVVGFGSQGHAHALNLHDSGVQVQVGLRDGSSSRAAAEDAGLDTGTVADAVRGAQVVAMLVPDHVQKGVWDEDVAPNLEPRRRGAVRARAERPLRADRAAGRARRDHGRAEGAGPPRPRAVRRGRRARRVSSRSTRTRAAARSSSALAYGVGIGCGRVGLLETTFAEETESDLFGEQAVLCGGVPALVQAGFDTLVEAGYQPEIAYYECLNELKLIVDLLYQGGYEYMRYSVSDVAEYGDLSRGPRIADDRTREEMRAHPRRDPQRRVRARAVRRRRRRPAQLRQAPRRGRGARAGDRARREGPARACGHRRPAGCGGAWGQLSQLTSASPSWATAPSARRSTGCSWRAATRSSGRPGTGFASCARSSAIPRSSAASARPTACSRPTSPRCATTRRWTSSRR